MRAKSNIFSRVLHCLLLIGVVTCEWQDFDFSRYHHQDDIKKLFDSYVEKFPTLAKIGSIGKSGQGREMYYIQITDQVDTAEPGEPMFKYVANIHGNEVVGRQLVVYLTQYLLENYGKDERVTNLVDTTNIFLMPSANPDGFESTSPATADDQVSQLCVGVRGRTNAAGVDLNRNFPDQFRARQNDPIQPETANLIQWIEKNAFVLSANLHGGSVVASYPYDDSVRHLQRGMYSPAPDDAIFK